MSSDARHERLLPLSARAGWTPAPADLALTGGLLAYGLAEAIVIGADEPNLAGRVAAAAGMVLPLLWRRDRPLVVLGLVVAVITGGTLAGVVPTDAILPLPSFVIAFFSAAAYSTSVRPAGGMAAVSLAAVGVGLALSETPDTPAAYLGVSFMAGVSFVLGRVVRQRTNEAVALTRLSAELEREREAHARAAVADERSRVSRELHDIVAHSISLIAIQSGAAAATVRRDPERAAAAIESVEIAAREALGEMRRLLSMLRGDEGPSGLAPQPGLTDVEDLVAQARAVGQAVELRVEGERQPIAPGIDLSAYRIVQESLTNARKHGAAGTTVISVAYRPHALEIVVSNPVSGPPTPDVPGHGLIGMQERVRLYGGDFAAGAQPDGAYRVVVALPTADDSS